MSEHPHRPTQARAVDWQRPVDDAAIAARLDALDADGIAPHATGAGGIDPEELLDSLDVLAEELVGRTGATATDLKERIRTLRQVALRNASRSGQSADRS